MLTNVLWYNPQCLMFTCSKVAATFPAGQTTGTLFVDDESELDDQSCALDREDEADINADLADDEEPFDADSVEAMMLDEASGLRVVFVTPEQVVLNNSAPAPMRRAVMRRRRALAQLQDSGRLLRIVVDEAHTVVQWGQDWRGSLTHLEELITMLRTRTSAAPPPPILALTGTADARMIPAIEQSLCMRNCKRVKEDLNRSNLRISVLDITYMDGSYSDILLAGAEVAFGHVQGGIRDGRGIVYVHQCRDAEAVASMLKGKVEGCNVFAYHKQLEGRAANLENWQKVEGAWLVATLAAGLGIDCPDVRCVMHLAFRRDITDYWQEICRGGRDGLAADCVTVWHPLLLEPVGRLSQLEPGSPAHGQLCQMLRALIGVDCSRGKGKCRRHALLPLLGEDSYARSTCDACMRCCSTLLPQASDRSVRSRDLCGAACKLLQAVLDAQQNGRALPYLETLRKGEWRRSLSAAESYALVSDWLCCDIIRLGSALSSTTRRYTTLQANEIAAFEIIRTLKAVDVLVHLDVRGWRQRAFVCPLC